MGDGSPKGLWTAHEDEYRGLLSMMRDRAARYGLVVNPDTSRVEKVVGLMTENLVSTGRPFCPCKQGHPLDPSADPVCPCREWLDEIERDGHCSCRLFFRGEPV